MTEPIKDDALSQLKVLASANGSALWQLIDALIARLESAEAALRVFANEARYHDPEECDGRVFDDDDIGVRSDILVGDLRIARKHFEAVK